MTKIKILITVIVLVAVYFGIQSWKSVENLEETTDGPYVFIENGKLIERKVEKGQIVEKELNKNAFEIEYKPDASVFSNISKIASLSDIHGQFDLAIEIMKNNKIIDENLNWNYGNGHFVIVGDIFDRGDKVNETLWFVYNLEKQAEKVGGKVHFLLGNHEFMILKNDDRYIHDKYVNVTKVLGKSYAELYGKNTVLGKWLRSKSTAVKINNSVFVHGGVSQEFLDHRKDFDLAEINEIMRSAIDMSKDEMKTKNIYEPYFKSNSLIWFRGYFYGDMKDEEVGSILKEIDSEHLVVGHCSNEEIVKLFDGKVYGVDSSIKKGEYGEILFIEQDNFSKGTKGGEKKKF
ncbi:metallophosphoesterase [Aureivirga sp. CE67]|uniref:metallophosphoesterase n=1 Tax=Aureivirga sp. CE67 TaxID=1788983 RepID=UPI0018CB0BCC|nr:metallophosphoesterase [Aureivirga sp. CE67]